MPSERQIQIRRAVSLGSCSKYLEKFSAKKEVCIFPRLFAFDLQLLRAYIPSHMFSEYFSRIFGVFCIKPQNSWSMKIFEKLLPILWIKEFKCRTILFAVIISNIVVVLRGSGIVANIIKVIIIKLGTNRLKWIFSLAFWVFFLRLYCRLNTRNVHP